MQAVFSVQCNSSARQSARNVKALHVRRARSGNGTMMARCRSRSFEVEAWQNEPGRRLPLWAEKQVHRGLGGTLIFSTHEGIFEARIGDWILQDDLGRVFPCAAELFHELYEPMGMAPSEA